MTTLTTTLNTFVSDVLLGKVLSSDLGYNVTEASVTWTADMGLGSLVAVAADGTAVAITSSNLASANGVIIDENAYLNAGSYTVGQAYTFVVAQRGCTFNGTKLVLSGTYSDANKATAVAALAAAGANKITTKFVVQA